MALTRQQLAELRAVLHEGGYDGSLFARARMVAWREENRSVPEIAELSGASEPTFRKWLTRYDEDGLEALKDRKSTGRPPVVTPEQRARLLALTRQSPPEGTALPEFATKVVDVVGLYLDPPAGAVVLSVDEKTQVQALDRTQPMLPLDYDRPLNAPTTTSATAQRTCSPRSTS